MKQVLIPALLMMLASSCKMNPEDLASEYCACHKAVETGKKTASDCREMAESHYLRLQDDDQAIKIYTEKVFDCIGSSESTEK